MKKIKRCTNCLKKANKRCGSCRAVKYCSAECQKSDYSQHKLFCKNLRNLAEYASDPNHTVLLLDTSTLKIEQKEDVVSHISKYCNGHYSAFFSDLWYENSVAAMCWDYKIDIFLPSGMLVTDMKQCLWCLNEYCAHIETETHPVVPFQPWHYSTKTPTYRFCCGRYKSIFAWLCVCHRMNMLPFEIIIMIAEYVAADVHDCFFKKYQCFPIMGPNVHIFLKEDKK